MLKKRLIFVVYFDSGYFFLSRNFRLQRVGDVNWLIDKFIFKHISKFIDEIIVFDVNREPSGTRCGGESFSAAINYLMKETFVPLTLGGGLNSIADVQRCFTLGADKVVFNTALITNSELVKECVSLFGSQAVLAAIDVFKLEGSYHSKISNSSKPGVSLEEHLEKAVSSGVGEIIINSIERDGTGVGFDLELAKGIQKLPVPLILVGGAGKPEHFGEALSVPNVEAVATGNLFNFMGRGFESVRGYLIENGYGVRVFR